LSQEQENLVKLAETQLSKTDRKKIEARERVLNLRKTRAESAEPRAGGPSKDKGKAPDPKDWGGIDLQDEELDLEAQREAFESYRLAREQASNLQEHQSEHSDSGTQRDPERTEEIASETLGRSTGSHSEYVPRAKAEAAIRALKERLANQYETRLEELGRGLTSGKGGKARRQRVAPTSTVDPVGDLVNQVLKRDATPLPPRSTPQAMDPV